MDEDDFQMFKIVVIGDSATGKTNIALRFVQDEFVEGFKPTVGVEFLNKVITVQGTKVKVTFWDTAGQERYKSLSKVYYKGALGIIIVYSVVEQQTYLNVQSWLRLANENLNIKDVVIIVLGNKIDLQDQKTVPLSKVLQDYKEKFGIQCFQVSAKTGQGVNESITYLIQEIYKKNVDGNNQPPVVVMDDSNYETVVPRPPSPEPIKTKETKKSPSKQPKATKKQQSSGNTTRKISKPKGQALQNPSSSKLEKKSSSCC